MIDIQKQITEIIGELEKGNIRLPVNRSLYLNQLLKTIPDTQIVKNSDYKKIINGLDKENGEDDIKIPESLEKILRYYQKKKGLIR